MTPDERALQALSSAYVALLRLSPVQRHQVRLVLVLCRDAIADLTDADPETVQTAHESLADQQGAL